MELINLALLEGERDSRIPNQYYIIIPATISFKHPVLPFSGKWNYNCSSTFCPRKAIWEHHSYTSPHEPPEDAGAPHNPLATPLLSLIQDVHLLSIRTLVGGNRALLPLHCVLEQKPSRCMKPARQEEGRGSLD